jgi:hypothetical protein
LNDKPRFDTLAESWLVAELRAPKLELPARPACEVSAAIVDANRFMSACAARVSAVIRNNRSAVELLNAKRKTYLFALRA